MTMGNEMSRTPAISSSGTSCGSVAESARRTSGSGGNSSVLMPGSIANAPGSRDPAQRACLNRPMSTCRHQALIQSDLERLWRLVGDPSRHPEWWPRVMEVKGGSFAEGDTYRQVTAVAIGRHETTLM